MTNDTKAPEKELMKALEKSVNFLDDTPEELYALFNPDEKFIHATPDKTFSTNVSLQCDYRIVEYVPKRECRWSIQTKSTFPQYDPDMWVTGCGIPTKDNPKAHNNRFCFSCGGEIVEGE